MTNSGVAVAINHEAGTTNIGNEEGSLPPPPSILTLL